MKNKFRVLLLTCVLVLSMCVPAFAEVITDEYNGTTVDEFKDYSITMYESFMGYDELTIEDYIINYEGTDPVLTKAFKNLQEMQATVSGAEAGEFVVETIEDDTDGVLLLSLYLTNESGEYVQKIVLNEEMYIIDFSFTVSDGPRDFGTLMARAGLNTLIGMGVVFAVLVLISFLISLFKYLPGSGAKKQKVKVAPKAKSTATTAGTKSADDEEMAAVIAAATAVADDDKELVAVISAAIAAATGTSADSFVVRSIKKRRW